MIRPVTPTPPDYGAFVPGPRCCVAATGTGALDGLRFAVKDLIDVAGAPTGGGNPDWLRTHPPAQSTAPAVAALLGGGARLEGKTVTDELAFSLEGENAHYGTPVNPRCADRLPGGSSSGSAVAVAARLVDFALGTDTGGSVRVPAAFCGLYGMRPTHGRISLEGVMPFAPSYDTVGWFARDGVTLRRVGETLLGAAVTGPAATGSRVHSAPPRSLARLLVASDAFALCARDVEPALRAAAERLGAADEVNIFGGGEARWLECYRVLQGAEVWASLGPWIVAQRPRFGAAIARRFEDAAEIAPDLVAGFKPVREGIRARLTALLGDDTALVVPTAPSTPLARDAAGPARGEFYRAALTLTCIAGHAGLPQVTLPAVALDGCPVGLSVIGPRQADEALLALAAQ